MEHDTLLAYLDQWAEEKSDEIWLRDFKGEASDDYSWRESRRQIHGVASALEQRFDKDTKILLLSKNRAHWFFADLAIMASGNVSVGLFTTLNADVAQYIAEFTESKAIFVGEAENWDRVKEVLADDVTVISLPGVDIPEATLTWDQLLSEGEGQSPRHVPKHDDMIALIFTSGTTGRPKGVIQTNDSNVIPIRRGAEFLAIEADPIYFSYLPLSHLAERQVIEFTSLCHGAPVSFNESLEFLGRDMQRTRPTFFFGAPRVWEQLQQAILAKFGGREAFDTARAADPEVIPNPTVAPRAEILESGTPLKSRSAGSIALTTISSASYMRRPRTVTEPPRTAPARTPHRLLADAARSSDGRCPPESSSSAISAGIDLFGPFSTISFCVHVIFMAESSGTLRGSVRFNLCISIARRSCQ